jgi:phage FluMu protein Com
MSHNHKTFRRFATNPPPEITPTLTRAQLDHLGCDEPSCDHKNEGPIFFHSHCHHDAPTWVSYHKDRGVIRIVCAECNKLIVQLLVAKSAPCPWCAEGNPRVRSSVEPTAFVHTDTPVGRVVCTAKDS